MECSMGPEPILKSTSNVSSKFNDLKLFTEIPGTFGRLCGGLGWVKTSGLRFGKGGSLSLSGILQRFCLN